MLKYYQSIIIENTHSNFDTFLQMHRNGGALNFITMLNKKRVTHVPFKRKTISCCTFVLFLSNWGIIVGY